MNKRAGSPVVPEHLATRRGEPRSLSLIVMKSFKPSGLNEPVKRHSVLRFCLETERHRRHALLVLTHRKGKWMYVYVYIYVCGG